VSRKSRPPLPRLAQALVAAVASLEGMSLRDSAEEGGGRYVSHPVVLSVTRAALTAQGLTLVPLALRHIGERTFVVRDGDHVVWLWEQVAELVHAPSGERLELTVQVTTPPHDWGAGAASALADKVLLMRLLRLSGDDRDAAGYTGAYGGGAHDPETGETRGRQAERELATGVVVADLVNELKAVPCDRTALAAWWASASQQLRRHSPTSSHWSALRQAFERTCAKANVDSAAITGRAA
jgi:hypothetical protein